MYPGPKLCREVWSRLIYCWVEKELCKTHFPVRQHPVCCTLVEQSSFRHCCKCLDQLPVITAVTALHRVYYCLCELSSVFQLQWSKAVRRQQSVPHQFPQVLSFSCTSLARSTARRVRSSAWRQVFIRTTYSNGCAQMSCSLQLLSMLATAWITNALFPSMCPVLPSNKKHPHRPTGLGLSFWLPGSHLTGQEIVLYITACLVFHDWRWISVPWTMAPLFPVPTYSKNRPSQVKEGFIKPVQQPVVRPLIRYGSSVRTDWTL